MVTMGRVNSLTLSVVGVTKSATQRPSCYVGGLYHRVLDTDAQPWSPHPPTGYISFSDAVTVSWKPGTVVERHPKMYARSRLSWCRRLPAQCDLCIIISGNSSH